MNAQAERSPSAHTEEGRHKVELWQLALVALGVLLLLAHPLLGTRIPLPGGGVVVGLLLPALLFVVPFLRRPAAKPVAQPPAPVSGPGEKVPGEAAELPVRVSGPGEGVSGEPGGSPAPGAPPAPGASPAPPASKDQELATDLRRAHRQHTERQSDRAHRARLAVYFVVPTGAMVSLALVGLFGAVVCFGLGAVVLSLLGRHAPD